MTSKLKLELLWWLLTAIIVVAVLVPIFLKIEDYPFYFMNVIFVVVFLTFGRYIFLLKHTFLAHRRYLMVAIILVSPILISYLISNINFFQTYLDEEGMDAIVGHLPFGERNGMIGYIRNELLLFGVGSVITAIVLPFRLVLSLWRSYNGTKV